MSIAIQVVDVDDVTETVSFCLKSGMPAKAIWEVAHPHVHALGDIVAALRGWLGFAPGPMVTMPVWAMTVVSFFATLAGWLGWRSPARPTALAQLFAGVVGDPGRWMQATGIRPKGLADILAQRPSNVQERWFARLYLLKPIAMLGLAAFWIATGLVALRPGRASATAQLAASGFPPHAVEMTVLLGAWFDVVLGALLRCGSSRAAF